MTIQKQCDNLIDWYEKFKPGAVDEIVLDCTLATIRKFCMRDISRKPKSKQKKGAPVQYTKAYGPWMYRGFKIVRAEKSDPRYKAQVDAFRSAVQ